jgi:hypothetical protein
MTWYIILLYIVATASTKLNNSVVGFQPLTTTHPFDHSPNFGIPARMTDYTQQQQQQQQHISTTSTKSIQPMIHQQQPFRRDPSSGGGRRSKTQLYFMGSDSGILGVGGPEVVRYGSIVSCWKIYIALFVRAF